MKNVFLFCIKKMALLSTAGAFVFLTGCTQTIPSQYYLLNPVADAAATSTLDANKLHIIGIGPIKFPKYLNRTQLVYYSGTNKLVINEFDRWAEPLDQNFNRVLRTNLTRLVSSSYATGYPWKRAMPIQYQVIMEVHQFEMQSDGTVNLSAHWAVVNLQKNKKIEVVKKFNYSQKLDTVDHKKIVYELSTALEKLSEDIAKELQQLLN